MATVFIGGAILLYGVWVLRKKVKDIREGKGCCGECSSCQGRCR